MFALTPTAHRRSAAALAKALAIALACGLLSAPVAFGQARSAEPVTLNFANAEIEAVARTMATITGRNVVVDPRVKGQLNLVTERAVSPEADAKLQGGSVSVVQGSSGSAPGGGQIVTQIFKLNFENAANLVPVLRP